MASRLPLHADPDLVCGIRLVPMRHPIRLSSGRCFELSAIVEYFRSGDRRCPLNRVLVTSANYAEDLRQALDDGDAPERYEDYASEPYLAELNYLMSLPPVLVEEEEELEGEVLALIDDQQEGEVLAPVIIPPREDPSIEPLLGTMLTAFVFGVAAMIINEKFFNNNSDSPSGYNGIPGLLVAYVAAGLDLICRSSNHRESGLFGSTITFFRQCCTYNGNMGFDGVAGPYPGFH